MKVMIKLRPLLLQTGADHRIVDKDGYTPLHIASQEGRDPVVSKLIQAGADPSTLTKSGRDAIATAAKKGHVGCVSLLLHHGVKVRWDHDLSPLKLAQTKVTDLLQDYKDNPEKYQNKSIHDVKACSTPFAQTTVVTSTTHTPDHMF